MNPFRILVIDDDFYASVSANSGFDAPAENDEFGFITEFLKPDHNGHSREDIEIFVSKDGAFETDVVLEIVSNTKHRQPRTFEKPVDLAAFLRSLQVLVLDLGGITLRSPLPDAGTVRSNLARCGKTLSSTPSDEDLAPIFTGNVSGIGFYHQHLDCLSRCAAVAVFTRYDSIGESDTSVEQSDLKAVEMFMDPFCGELLGVSHDDDGVAHCGIPWTIKFKKTPAKPGECHPLKHIIDALHRDHTKGFYDLTNRGAIEFAASTDYPVLIVGESGTGKEGIANSIHDAWAQRHGLLHSPFIVLNCAGRSSELAQSELFGHVKGSFTGADDHRLGAILRVCGITELGVGEGEKDKDRRLKRNAEALAKALKDFQASGDENETSDAFVRRVLPLFHSLFNPPGGTNAERYDQSLIGVMDAIRRRLQPAAARGGLTDDFRDRLLEGANGRLEPVGKDGLDLKFTGQMPVGTLLLDEFGDLPPDVQNLLLRFLEEKCREVQPLGYSGRISGLKAKIIVATSDPRVAQFAGVELLGAWRSESENARPLRADLLQRVCYHVIRAEPVETEEQIERCVNALVASRETAGISWEPSATNAIKARVLELIEKIKTASTMTLSQRAAGLPWFGHRRQLSVVVRLACEYARTAHARGLRGELFQLSDDGKPRVTDEIIKRIWRVATVRSPQTLPVADLAVAQPYHQAPDRKQKLSAWTTIEEFRGARAVKAGDILDHLLQLFLSNRDERLDDEEILSHLNGFEKRTRRDSRKLMLTPVRAAQKVSALRTILEQKAPFVKSGVHLVGNCLSTTKPC